MSYHDASGQATGYSAELCRRIATAVKEQLKLSDLKVTLVPLNTEERIDARVVAVANRDEAMKQLQAKQVDAYAGDQIVQIGFLMQAPDPSVYKLSHDLFSYEPYALVVRRNDADFRLVADRALAQLYRTGQIEQVYAQSFGKADLRPSPVLAAMYALGALPE